MILQKGKLIILSSVAGGGKSTLIAMLLKNHPDWKFSISCTTRPQRPGDTPGKTYSFLTTEDFQKKISEGYFLEWAKVHDNYYGTPKQWILDALEFGNNVILDIDVQGAFLIKEQIPSARTIFILPPSEDIWIHRLKTRGTDNPEVVEKRIRNGKKELSYADQFDFRIVNDNLNVAYKEFEQIIQK